VEVVIGDSITMASAESRESFPGFMYVYVPMQTRPICTPSTPGADSVESRLDTPYRDRRAMVRDPFGNVFQIAHFRLHSRASTKPEKNQEICVVVTRPIPALRGDAPFMRMHVRGHPAPRRVPLERRTEPAPRSGADFSLGLWSVVVTGARSVGVSRRWG
jgi:hypothetical protein